ncbi:MAG: hypothetical protein JW856_04195 [Dehalococcoidales bacterium]|nr:hypothetical protein [Dehalococcoidales bacterium]
MTIVDDKFREWTRGRDAVQSRINIFEKIRDIPYAVIPELVDYRRYADIFKFGKGSCSPKHFLLGEMFQRLGLRVLFVVYPYRWDESAEILKRHSSRLREMARAMPVSHHIACMVEIDGRSVLVDATLDPPLHKAGLPVNVRWDGKSDTILPMIPCGEEEIYHPLEARLMRPAVNEQSLLFYEELNTCLEQIRQFPGRS